MISHPLSIGLILLIQTTIISLITGNFRLNYWFSYILFLILVGRILILFIYITRIASNEKFSFRKNYFILILIPIIMFFSNKINFHINSFNNEFIILTKPLYLHSSITKFLNFPSNIILLFMIIYLLLTLVVVVKITNFKNGPLRLKN